MATVGSVDIIPASPAGKFISMLMMLVGLIFFGMLTASIAYWYLERMEKKYQAQNESELDDFKEVIDNLQSEIKELKNLIKENKE